MYTPWDSKKEEADRLPVSTAPLIVVQCVCSERQSRRLYFMMIAIRLQMGACIKAQRDEDCYND